jgi:hypothetical protein
MRMIAGRQVLVTERIIMIIGFDTGNVTGGTQETLAPPESLDRDALKKITSKKKKKSFAAVETVL